MNEYRTLLHTVAENPGATADEINTAAKEVRNPVELLQQAETDGDVVCVNERYWIVRSGEFAFDEYDHPQTNSSE